MKKLLAILTVISMIILSGCSVLNDVNVNSDESQSVYTESDLTRYLDPENSQLVITEDGELSLIQGDEVNSQNNLKLLEYLEKDDIYYGKPVIRQSEHDGNVIATYVLTDDVESIFPLSTDVFLNLSDYEIGNSYINFFLFEEMNLVDGLYDYNEFIQYALNNGAKKFDDNHIIVNMNKDEILNMTNSLTEMDLN